MNPSDPGLADPTRPSGAASAPVPARPPSGNALPLGTRLGEFRLDRVIGEGGFGIVYLAHDLQLERVVALKEFMPASVAMRAPDQSILLRSEHHREAFEAGLRSFINEARLLARFDHPALVKVYRFWEERGTACMVMPFYEGPTLKQWLREQPAPPPEAWLLRMVHPLLDALERLHAENCFHRDIAPDNILLLSARPGQPAPAEAAAGPLDTPLLLDFGAARRLIGDMTQNLTVILKPGFAPVEQYAEVPSMKQGPWTDVYALSAVLYAAIGGKAPSPSIGRLFRDDLVPARELGRGRYSEALLGAIDAGLAVRPEQRLQDVAALRAQLPPVEPAAARGVAPRAATTLVDPVAAPAAPAAASRTEAQRGAPPPGAASGPGAAARTAAMPAGRPAQAAVAAPVAALDDDRTVVHPGRAGGGGAPASTPVPAVRGARSPLPWVLGGLALGAAAVAVILLRSPSAPGGAESPPSPTPAAAVAAAPSPAATGVAPDAGAAPAGAAATPAELLQRLAAARDPAWTVTARPERERLVIERDRFGFTVDSAADGHVYVLMAETDGRTLSMLFPNADDRDNRIAAGVPLVLPRRQWEIVAGGPPGVDRVLVMVSRHPRDFAAAGLVAEGRFGRFDPVRAREAAAADAAGRPRLAGAVQCPAGGAGCDAGYGAAVFEVSEVAP